MLKVYPAVFQKEENSYWVEFPDLPGCHTCGNTLEETMELAQEALGLYLIAVLEDKETLPRHSNLTELTAPANGTTFTPSCVPSAAGTRRRSGR